MKQLRPWPKSKRPLQKIAIVGYHDILDMMDHRYKTGVPCILNWKYHVNGII